MILSLWQRAALRAASIEPRQLSSFTNTHTAKSLIRLGLLETVEGLGWQVRLTEKGAIAQRLLPPEPPAPWLRDEEPGELHDT